MTKKDRSTLRYSPLNYCKSMTYNEFNSKRIKPCLREDHPCEILFLAVLKNNIEKTR